MRAEDRPLGESAAGRRPVPVGLAGGDEGDVADAQALLFGRGRDDALARGHEHDLFGIVDVHLRARAVAEGELAHPELRALAADRVLVLVLADEQVSGPLRPPGGAYAFDDHGGQASPRAPRVNVPTRPALSADVMGTRTILVVALVLAAGACAAPAVPATSAGARLSPSLTPRAAHDVAVRLGSITGLGVAPDGSVYVVLFGANKIAHLSATGATLGSWGKTGAGPGDLGMPGNVAVARDGTVYVADHDNDRVQAFAPDGAFLRSFGAPGTGPGQFTHPVAIAVDAAGNVYVGEDRNARVQKFDPRGTLLLQIGSPGTGDDKFSDADGIAVDGAGNIWVSDYTQNRVQKFDATGKLLLAFGKPGTGPGEFAGPASLAVLPDGTLVVCDYTNDRLQLFDASGRFLEAIGQGGGDPGQLRRPWGVAVDARGTIFVSEYGNGRIQAFDPR